MVVTDEQLQADARAAEQLGPRGFAWTVTRDSTLANLLRGLAEPFAEVEQRVLDLLAESNPLTTSELLPEWEESLGLPGPCLALPPQSTEARRALVAEKWSRRGGQSAAYMIARALELGYVVTVREFRPFEVGRSTVGERLTNGAWVFVWRVVAPSHTARFLRCGSGTCGEPLSVADNAPLECTMQALKPAHTRVEFRYNQTPEGWQPWTEIGAEPVELQLTVPVVSVT